MSPERYLHAKHVIAALAKRHPAPEWAFFEQVANSTGFSASRWADAMAFNVYPSRGLEIHGFEVKVSRGDWLRELKEPAKVEDGNFRFCHRWWVVVGDAEIVKEGELPTSWGLLVPDARHGLKAAVKAPLLGPQEPTRAFLAATLRKAAEASVPLSALEERVAEKAKQLEEQKDWRTQELERRLGEVEKRVAEFEAASGVKIERWNAGQIGAAVKLFMGRSLPEHVSRFEQARNLVAASNRDLEAGLQQLRDLTQGEQNPLEVGL